MKARNRTSRMRGRRQHQPAGFKLYRKVLKHRYGHLWREYVDLG
jgi:hypothetical protein